MKRTPPAAEVDPHEQFVELVRKLHETQQKLNELTGGEVDAVLHSGGQSYLLHRAQEQLRESEERFRGMFAGAVIGIAVSTPEGRYLQANPAYCGMLGYTEKELQGRDFFSLTHPDDLALDQHLWEETLTGQRESLVSEKRYLKKSGETLWARCSVSATHDADGQVATFIIIAEDITERKRAEQQLSWKTAFFEAQVHSSWEGVFIVDAEGHTILQNQRLIEIWNIPEAFAPETSKARRIELVAQAIKNPEPYLQKVSWLYDHPEAVSRDEIELLDGRILDRYSAPVRGLDGKYYGRIWSFRDMTEERTAEKRAAEQIDLINMASRVGKLGAWALEFPGPKVVWSDEVFHIHEVEPGFTPDLATALDFYPSPSREKLEAAIAGKRPYDLELNFLTAKGNKRWVRTTSMMEMKNGQARLYGILQDITARKEAEMENLFKEQRYRSLVEATSSIVWDTPASGEFTEEQPGWTTFTGQSFEQLQGWGWLDAIHPDDRPETKRVWSEALANQTFYEVEHRLRARDQTYHDMMVRAVPILGEGGVIRHWTGIHIDITERKKTEARFRRLVNSNVQGVIFWNKKGEVRGANDAFLKLVGYTREDLEAGRISWIALTPPIYAHLDERALEQIAVDGVAAPYEKEFQRKDGSRVPVLIGAAAFEDDPDEGVCFTLDLTERKKLEHQFLRAQRVESIGTLAGGIAHDLNNILAPIMMAVQFLKGSATNPQAKEILETIEVSAKRGAEIVRQVLSFSRGMEGERVEIQPEQLLKDIVTIIKDTFPKDIRREINLPGDSWTVLGDPTQLHQILLNLCVNARDAMVNGGTLTLKVENMVIDDQFAAMNVEAKPGRYVAITVNDTGTGMAPEVIDKIFDPFFTTKELGKGTGLGLSTVLAIAKSHGGFINVYSELGKGTRFGLYLPSSEAPPKAKSKTVSLASLPRGKGQTILIIDDEAAILTVTSQTLKAYNYQTLTATDGAEGVALYAEQRDNIAVVIIDMAMPIMDGPSAIRAIMKLNPAVKIIAASGLKTDGAETRIAAAGIKHFLTKPFTAGTLLRTVRTILGEDRGASRQGQGR